MRPTKLALLSTLALWAAACGGDTGGTTTTSATSTTEGIVTSTSTTSSTSMPTTSSTVAATSTTIAPSITSTTMAGVPIDFGPAEGDVLMVVGVRHDDVLNLRAAPGADQPIREEIPPTFDDLIAMGNTRDLSTSFWIEVDYEGTPGWVHMGYIGYGGDTSDATSNVIDELGERPVESTMVLLGERVASVFVSEDVASEVVQVTPVTADDLVEVTYDVIGMGDDAVRGVRIHIFAEPASGGFSLRTVEATVICTRGVDEGTCV